MMSQQVETAYARISGVIRSAVDRCLGGDVGMAFDEISDTITRVRREQPYGVWRDLVSRLQEDDAVRKLRQEPFTRRAYEKPRGYPGDAVMLDYIYAQHFPMLSMSDASVNDELKLLHRYVTKIRPTPIAVYCRCAWFAQRIDEVALSRSRAGKQARILSIAAGHLRERHLSTAIHNGLVGEVVAIDQDAESLKTVESDTRGLPITTKRMSVQEFLRHPDSLGTFDYIYAGGLYDYLPDRIGTALIDAVFIALNSGGAATLANFVPDHPDLAYMEAVMDWHLQYRTEMDLQALFRKARTMQNMRATTWQDAVRCIAYLEIEKLQQ